MDRLMGACGLVCSDCGAYKGTKANDADAIAEVAKEWSEMFKTDIKPDFVWCDGCMVEGRKCGHCAECDIRACVKSRGLDNCATCEDYACDKIKRFFKSVPCSKERLDEIRAQKRV